MKFSSDPSAVFGMSLIVLVAGAGLGALLRRRSKPLSADVRADFELILASTLTLLGLIVGFSFSMAVGRYDLRKHLEAAEADAIGTEYLRAELMAPRESDQVRRSLRAYLDQRILFFTSPPDDGGSGDHARTAELQEQLWAPVRDAAAEKPTSTSALIVAGMNDVLSSQGRTQAAFLNQIPATVWALLGLIGFASNVLLGFGAQGVRSGRALLLIVPLTISLSFYLIAEIDSPRGGLVRVSAQNLESLAASIRTP